MASNKPNTVGEIPPPTPPSRSPTPCPGRPKRSPVWQYFVYNEQTGKSSCQLETGRSDDEQEVGPSTKICTQEVAGKFPTNLKQHLKKPHILSMRRL